MKSFIFFSIIDKKYSIDNINNFLNFNRNYKIIIFFLDFETYLSVFSKFGNNKCFINLSSYERSNAIFEIFHHCLKKFKQSIYINPNTKIEKNKFTRNFLEKIKEYDIVLEYNPKKIIGLLDNTIIFNSNQKTLKIFNPKNIANFTKSYKNLNTKFFNEIDNLIININNYKSIKNKPLFERLPFYIKKIKDFYIPINQIIINSTNTNGLSTFDNLPIGVAYTFSKYSLYKKIEIISNREKTNLLLNAINTRTDIRRRGNSNINRAIIVETLRKNDISNKTYNLNEYFKKMGNSKFVISPEGNGIDCHRHYETWITGGIPIIEYNEKIIEKYKDLPILFTNDYSEINEEYLNEKYKEFENKYFNYEKLLLQNYKGRDRELITHRSNYWITKLY